jgi:type II secretion system protein C
MLAGAAPQAGAGDGTFTWRLSGTLLNGADSKALLHDGRGAERLLRVGEHISDCELVQVTRRGAAFRCDPGAETLSLRPELGARGGVWSGSGGQDPGRAPYRQVSRAWLHALVADKQRLVRAVAFQPVVHHGAMHGYRLSHISDSAGLGRLGLQRDDIVVSVNGAPVSQPEAFMETLNALSQARAISLGIERDSGAITLHYLLR